MSEEPTMKSWTQGALSKLKYLTGQSDFVRYYRSDEQSATLIFKGRTCEITALGKVTWAYQ